MPFAKFPNPIYESPPSQSGANSVRIKFAARNLDKKDTFGKSDPYFVINRMMGAGQVRRRIQTVLPDVARQRQIWRTFDAWWQYFFFCHFFALSSLSLSLLR